MIKNFILVVCALSGTATLAQQTPSPPPKQEFAWVAGQAPEMKRLAEAFAGVWKTTEKFEPDEFRISGATGSGAYSIHPGPGGNSLIIDYKSESSVGLYSSTRIIYWDRKSGLYRVFYCDSLQPIGCGEGGTGTWEGNDLVFESTGRGPGGPIQMKQRFSDISSAGFIFSLDMINQGKQKRSLTIQARKNGAEP